MQEEYQKKLEEEIQGYISNNYQSQGMDSLPKAQEANDKITSQRKALKKTKQMLYQSRGESRSPEKDWDYYDTHPQARGSSQKTSKIPVSDKRKGEGKELPKRAASTPLEEEPYPRNYATFGLSSIEKRYSCENCQKRHEPPLCVCPNCGGPHLISKCPFSGIPEWEEIPVTEYNEPWKRCSTCHLCHQGTCPCAEGKKLAHGAIAVLLLICKIGLMCLSPRGLREIRFHQKEWFKPLKQTKCSVVNVEYLIHQMNHANIQRYPSPWGVHPVVEDKMTI